MSSLGFLIRNLFGIVSVEASGSTNSNHPTPPSAGSPFQHHVTDSFSPRASGQGLVAASQGVRTSFRVHTDGRPGAVEVTIQGVKMARSSNFEFLI